MNPGKLELVVTGRGYVESGRAEDVYCNVEGQTTIIKIVARGPARSRRGMSSAELDSAALKDQLINQRITTRKPRPTYLNARLTREVAEIALKEYIEGIFKQDLEVLTQAIDGCRAAIRKIEERLERTRKASQRLKEALAAAGGAKTPADIVAEVDIQDRLEEAELTLGSRTAIAGAGGGQAGGPGEIHPRQDDQGAGERDQEGPRR